MRSVALGTKNGVIAADQIRKPAKRGACGFDLRFPRFRVHQRWKRWHRYPNTQKPERKAV